MTTHTINLDLTFEIDVFDVDEIPQELIDNMLIETQEGRDELVKESKAYLLSALP